MGLGFISGRGLLAGATLFALIAIFVLLDRRRLRRRLAENESMRSHVLREYASADNK